VTAESTTTQFSPEKTLARTHNQGQSSRRMRISFRRRRLCLFLAIVGLEASHVVSYKNSALRSSSSSSSSANPQRGESTSTSESAASASPEWERIHVIRRVYGEDNRAVRAEMRRIEGRIPRYQTGIPGDLNHVVPYENHPYEKSKWRRRLQDSNSTSSTGADNATSTGDGGDTYSTNGTTADGSSGARFQPMRFKYFTYALDAIRDDSNAAKIDWYISTILPKTVEFWSRALSVVPVSGNLKLSSSELDSRLYCGDSEFTEVPSEHISDGVADADLILYVSASASSTFCPDRTLAVAVPCK
jgi:Leishmanolysin